MVSILPKMVRDNDRTFYKFVRPLTRDNYNKLANEIIDTTAINLLKEILVILNQLWKINPNRIDEKLVNQKSLYNMIKNKIAKDGKTLPFNTKEL